MIPRAIAIFALLAGAAVPVLAQQKCTPPPPSCGDKAEVCGGISNVSDADLQDAFDVVVASPTSATSGPFRRFLA